jgi:hypothetical protein
VESVASFVDNWRAARPEPLRPGAAPNRAAERSPDDVDDLVDVAIGITVLGGGPHAALDMVLEDEHRERIDRSPQCAGLLEDVHAVLLPLDHSGDAADLALDARKPPDQLRLVAGVAVAEVLAAIDGGGVGARRGACVGCGHERDDTPGEYPPQPGSPPAVVPPNGYTPERMDPLDHLLALPDGLTCSVCEEPVPADRVRLLAWRDDLAFLQIDCPGCLSTTLGFAVGGTADASAAPSVAPPISSDDVLDMHQLLATWRGDLQELLSRSGRGHAESSQ